VKTPVSHVLLAVCLSLCGVAAAQDPDVSGTGVCATSPCTTTYHNNNARTGVNSHETILKPSSLPNFTHADFQLDSMVYAQPLYISSVAFNGGPCTPGTPRDIAYVVTENNTIYAIDADNYQECTHVNLNIVGAGEAAIPVSALPGGPHGCNNLTGSPSNGTLGITGTPVIDPGNNVIFFVTSHQAPNGQGGYNYTQRLQARKLTDLSQWDVLDIPNAINTANPSSPTFYALNENQRAGLLLAVNSNTANVVVAWSTNCDSSIPSGGSFGLVAEFDFSYSTDKFDSTSIESFYPLGPYTNISTTPPPTGPAGVWMSGGAPAADAGGNVYVSVGNGNFEAMTSPLTYGQSILKLSGSSLSLSDYYTPNDWSQLNLGSGSPTPHAVGCAGVGQPSCLISGGLAQGDWDLGSGGVVLLKKSSSTAYGELVAAGKEGMFYVTWYCSSSTCPAGANWNRLMGGLDGGGYSTDSSSTDWKVYGCTPASAPAAGYLAQCLYIVPVTSRPESGERGTPAYWSPGGTASNYLYTVGTGDQNTSEYFKAFQFSSGQLSTTWAEDGNILYGYPGATPTVSWSGTDATTGIVWVLETDTYDHSANNRAILRAYQATPSGSSMVLKWTSISTTGPGAVKFSVPTVANGKVFVAGEEVNTTPNGCGRLSGCAGLLTIYH
jgi:hypothetical protein